MVIGCSSELDLRQALTRCHSAPCCRLIITRMFTLPSKSGRIRLCHSTSIPISTLHLLARCNVHPIHSFTHSSPCTSPRRSPPRPSEPSRTSPQMNERLYRKCSNTENCCQRSSMQCLQPALISNCCFKPPLILPFISLNDRQMRARNKCISRTGHRCFHRCYLDQRNVY